MNTTAGGSTKHPSYTNVTGGEYGDTLQTRLVGGKVVCTTCHNAMQKPGDPGRSWELGITTDNVTYRMRRYGWAYYSFLKPVVYRDTSFWQGPTYLKERKQYVVPESEYDVDPVAGTITFHQAQPPEVYIYVTLGDDYLRSPNVENRFCGDCHQTASHKGADCTICHGTHNTVNRSNIRERLGTPNGYKDVAYLNATGMSGGSGVCTVCHTRTMYHNSTAILPPHHEGTVCTDCHPHEKGFPSFTTVLNTLLKRLYAFVTGENAYAGPPAWSGKQPAALPPGLQNHSLPEQAWENGLVRFSVSVEVVNGPVAQQSSQSAIKDDIIMYYHNDHLGTPLFMSDESGAAVWRREQEPFGATTFERGTATENLRFPGQYWDAGKGSSYNHFRDNYDPKLGR